MNFLQNIGKEKLITIVGVAIVAIALSVTAIAWGYKSSKDEIAEGTPQTTDEIFTDDEIDEMTDGLLPHEIEGAGSLEGENDLSKSPLWYQLDEKTEKKSSTGNSSTAYNNVIRDINKQVADRNKGTLDNNTKPSNTGNGGNTNQGNSGPTTISPNGNSGSNWNSGSTNNGNSNTNTGGNNNNVNNDSTIEINNETIDPSGNSSSTSDPSKFDVYKYVDKNTPILSGSSLKQKVFDALNGLTENFVVMLDGSISSNEIAKWITEEYNSMLLINSISYGKLDEKQGNFVYFELKYLITKQQQKDLITYSKGVAKAVANKSEIDRVKHVADVVSKMGKYSDKGANVFSPWTLYKNGIGVCQAYTSMGKYLLDSMGIKNGIAVGVLDGVPHTWNVVVIDGKTYHSDFTLVDTKSNLEFALIDASNINKDRTVDHIILQ